MTLLVDVPFADDWHRRIGGQNTRARQAAKEVEATGREAAAPVSTLELRHALCQQVQTFSAQNDRRGG